MNSEFQWRNEMRKLDGPEEPARDLWPAIAARIASTSIEVPTVRHRRGVRWMAIAAALVVAIGAGVTTYRWQSQQRVEVIATTRQPALTPEIAADQLPHTALEWAVPDDPALARTAENLDTASAQLQSALEQRPDAVFLVGLLNRTNSMRLRLLRKSSDAG